MRDIKLKGSWKEFSRAIDRNYLGAVGEVGVEPEEIRARKTKRGVETLRNDGTINDVKSGRQIEKRQERQFIIILSREVVNNFGVLFQCVCV